MTTFRRLLSEEQVADKIGFSRSWFNRKRPELEALGFPKPVLDNDRLGARRWDDKAIDLWLDARMSPNLLALTKPPAEALDIIAITSTLQQRARELAL